MFREEILTATFPTPFERAVNRVDVRDLGRACARALLDRSLRSGAYPVVGPSSLTGDECAAHWAEALGRDVRCARDSATIDAALGRLPPKKRDDFQKTFAVLRRFALPTKPGELARTEALIGQPPCPYARYVAQTASAWRPMLRPPYASAG